MSDAANTIAWRDNYAAYFRPLTPRQEEAIERVLQSTISKCTTQEVDRAVANICETWNMAEQRHVPNVNDIKIRILTLRKIRGQQAAEVHGVKIGDHEQALRVQLRECQDPAKRFDIVCEGSSYEMCRRLEQYAKTLPGGLVRLRPDIRKLVDEVVSDLESITKKQVRERDKV